MATKKTQEERDYQDTLKVTQSMLGDMSKAMADMANSADGRNKKLKEQTDITRDILNNVNDIADTEKIINQVNRQRAEINNTNYGVNEKLKQSQLAQLDAVEGILKAAQDTEKVFKAVNDITSETTNHFSEGIDGIMTKLEGIPIVGKALKNFFQPFADSAKSVISKTADKFSSGFKKAFLSAREGGASFTKSLGEGITGGVKGMGSMVSTVGRLLAAINPVVLAVIAIGLAAYAGYKRFVELDEAAKGFREETGLLNSQTRGLQSNIKAVSNQFAGLGVSAEDVGRSAAAFTNEFAGLEQPSKEVLGSMVSLNKNFGIGVEEGAQLNKVFQNIGGLSAAQSQALIGQTAEMARMAGVAPQKVIQDMAENSETAYRYFNGSPKELAKAAVQAAKLGTSIAQAGKVADGLLDFESSITAELEASALLGTNINLGQARYLAANGKILESQQAVLDEVAGIGDLTKLNTFEQEALAKATNMEFGDLVNQQRIREKFGKLNEEQLAAANALIDSGRDISELSDKDLANQTQRLASQKEMQSYMDDMQNTSSALSTAFMDMFEPVTSFVMPILGDLFKILSKVLLPLFRMTGTIFKAVFKPLKAVYDIISAIVMPLVEIASAIIDALITPFETAIDALDPLFTKISELKDVTMRAAGPIMNVFKAIANVVGGVFGGAIGLVVDVLVAGIDIIFKGISAIASFINDYLVQPIMSVVNTIGGAFSSIGSFIGIEGESTNNTGSTTTPSINDGVVQDGKVVSTNPADTIFAMKKPEDLANSATTIQQSPTIDISALVSKMDEMIQAVSANRDVYMDREKVSSAVVTSSEKSSQNRFGLMGA